MDTIRTELHERLHRLHRLMRRRHMDRRRGDPLADRLMLFGRGPHFYQSKQPVVGFRM